MLESATSRCSHVKYKYLNALSNKSSNLFKNAYYFFLESVKTKQRSEKDELENSVDIVLQFENIINILVSSFRFF